MNIRFALAVNISMLFNAFCLKVRDTETTVKQHKIHRFSLICFANPLFLKLYYLLSKLLGVPPKVDYKQIPWHCVLLLLFEREWYGPLSLQIHPSPRRYGCVCLSVASLLAVRCCAQTVTVFDKQRKENSDWHPSGFWCRYFKLYVSCGKSSDSCQR